MKESMNFILSSAGSMLRHVPAKRAKLDMVKVDSPNKKTRW